jgi:hypothetical protein
LAIEKDGDRRGDRKREWSEGEKRMRNGGYGIVGP